MTRKPTPTWCSWSGNVKTAEWRGPISVRMGLLTPTEFAALAPNVAAEVEELTVSSASRPGHDEAWFQRNRDEIREQLGFFLGIALSGTSYKE